MAAMMTSGMKQGWNVLAFLLGTVLTAHAWAQVPATDPEPWRITLAPYAWLPGVEGQIGTPNRSISVDQDFAQIVHDSDSIIGVMGDVEIRKGRWGGYINGVYMRIGIDDVGPGPIQTDLAADLIYVEAACLYRFGEWGLGSVSPDKSASCKISLDGYLGARYTHLGFNSDFQRGLSVERSKDWVDPLVGTKVTLNLTRNWQLLFQGDVGGFGAGSQIALSGTTLLGYTFALDPNVDMSLFVGYRALYQDFVSGHLDWQVTLHGPILGMAFEF